MRRWPTKMQSCWILSLDKTTFKKFTMKLFFGLALVLSLHVARSAFAQEYDFGIAAKQQMRDTPIGLHIALSNTSLVTCSEAQVMSKNLEKMRQDRVSISALEWDQADYARCVDMFKKAIKESSVQAAKGMKSKGAKDALKEHVILALAALQGTLPTPGESAAERATQTATAKRDLQKQQARLEAEIN